MWEWLVRFSKDVWDPTWKYRELTRRRLEDIFAKQDAEMKQRDEAREKKRAKYYGRSK